MFFFSTHETSLAKNNNNYECLPEQRCLKSPVRNRSNNKVDVTATRENASAPSHNCTQPDSRGNTSGLTKYCTFHHQGKYKAKAFQAPGSSYCPRNLATSNIRWSGILNSWLIRMNGIVRMFQIATLVYQQSRHRFRAKLMNTTSCNSNEHSSATWASHG